MNRKNEISELLRKSPEAIRIAAGKHLEIFADCDAIHRRIAGDMADFIAAQNSKGEKSRFICPVGPVGQYEYFVKTVNDRRISLKNCWFFYMDEYADQAGHAVPVEHPLSFQGEMRRSWLAGIDPELAIPEEQLIFPDEKNIHLLADLIRSVGGIDICFGGIGIHGHLAFNEPEPEVEYSDPRLVYLNDYTITINAVRAGVGGNLEGFPRKAYTLGMAQILNARQVRLACRNGIALAWANTVLRLALLGTPGSDYPCTFINRHPDYVIYTDHDTLSSPEVIL